MRGADCGRMYREISLIALLAAFPLANTRADPIHAVADGAYWHHGSHWTFPESVGRYVRVGIPQDVAGSEDAVAYYAYEEGDQRYTAVVDVYLANSAFVEDLEGSRLGKLISEEVFAVNGTQGLAGTRRVYEIGLSGEKLKGIYFVSAGDWRVRIRIVGLALPEMDAFVRGQQWDKLGGH